MYSSQLLKEAQFLPHVVEESEVLQCKKLAQRHRAREWQSQDLKPGPSHYIATMLFWIPWHLVGLTSLYTSFPVRMDSRLNVHCGQQASRPQAGAAGGVWGWLKSGQGLRMPEATQLDCWMSTAVSLLWLDSHTPLPTLLVDQLSLGYATCCVLFWQNWPTKARIAELAREASLPFKSQTSGCSLSDKDLQFVFISHWLIAIYRLAPLQIPLANKVGQINFLKEEIFWSTPKSVLCMSWQLLYFSC